MQTAILTLASIGFVQLLAVMSPGPSFLITARTAVARSRGDGIMVALGLGVGTIVWAGAALLGLKFVFQQNYWLFVSAKTVGALFLLWIAWKIFRHAAEPVEISGASSASAAGNPFLRGVFTQLSNPKVAVFFGSIFVAMLPAELPGWMAATLLGIVTLNEIAWYSLVALFFGLPPVRRSYIAAKTWIDRITGIFLGFLGVRLLWAAREAA